MTQLVNMAPHGGGSVLPQISRGAGASDPVRLAIAGIVIDMADVDPGSRSFTVKGRATRERIISCATELVLREGFAALSMENVRKAASVSGSQITHYFKDKDSLVRAVVSRQTQALHDFHRQSALRGLDTFEDLDRWAELTLKMGRRRKRT